MAFVVGGDVVSLAQDGKLGSFDSPLNFNLKKQKKRKGFFPSLIFLIFLMMIIQEHLSKHGPKRGGGG